LKKIRRISNQSDVGSDTQNMIRSKAISSARNAWHPAAVRFLCPRPATPGANGRNIGHNSSQPPPLKLNAKWDPADFTPRSCALWLISTLEQYCGCERRLSTQDRVTMRDLNLPRSQGSVRRHIEPRRINWNENLSLTLKDLGLDDKEIVRAETRFIRELRLPLNLKVQTIEEIVCYLLTHFSFSVTRDLAVYMRPLPDVVANIRSEEILRKILESPEAKTRKIQSQAFIQLEVTEEAHVEEKEKSEKVASPTQVHVTIKDKKGAVLTAFSLVTLN
jgi:hypothetical protein